MKFWIINLSLCMASVCQADSFTTDGNGIRDTISASANGKSILYVSEIDGAVSCYTASGRKLWRNPTQHPAVMFEIEASDIDGDGNDDLLAASADGNIYHWGHDGKLRWSFNPGRKVRFSEVAVVKNSDAVQIFAGGNDYILYELNRHGQLVSETKFDGIIRKLEAGAFLQKGKQSLFLMAMTGDKWAWSYMAVIDPKSKKAIKTGKLKSKDLSGFRKLMINEVSVADVDGDSLDDLLFLATGRVETAAKDGPGQFIVLNGQLKPISPIRFSQDRQAALRSCVCGLFTTSAQ
ncbi:MAG: hypothetical protein ACR2OR_04640 [Hyphomicrobiales bacterium]